MAHQGSRTSQNLDYAHDSRVICVRRRERDVQNLSRNRIPGIYVAADERDLTIAHALIIGPADTPYQGGFFCFEIRFPEGYPYRPPNVKLMTTDGGSVQFNPNLYCNGRVCLSILGTYKGPGWTASMTLEGVLISILSLMNAKPYYNESGFNEEEKAEDAMCYNRIIQHETLRVAVAGMLETPPLGLHRQLREEMQLTFLDNYKKYVTTCIDAVSLDNTRMLDPLGTNKGTFDHASILQRLEWLKEKLEEGGKYKRLRMS